MQRSAPRGLTFSFNKKRSLHITSECTLGKGNSLGECSDRMKMCKIRRGGDEYQSGVVVYMPKPPFAAPETHRLTVGFSEKIWDNRMAIEFISGQIIYSGLFCLASVFNVDGVGVCE